MAGLNFIWSMGAASPGEVIKEIDFVHVWMVQHSAK